MHDVLENQINQQLDNILKSAEVIQWKKKHVEISTNKKRNLVSMKQPIGNTGRVADFKRGELFSLN